MFYKINFLLILLLYSSEPTSSNNVPEGVSRIDLLEIVKK